MSENKHTPGPWEAQCFAVYAPDNDMVAHTGILGNAFSTAQNEANARLISAAPELLAKAQAVLAWWDKWLPTVTHNDHPECEDAEWKEFFELRRVVEQATE